MAVEPWESNSWYTHKGAAVTLKTVLAWRVQMLSRARQIAEASIASVRIFGIRGTTAQEIKHQSIKQQQQQLPLLLLSGPRGVITGFP